jgi:biotin transporter BioY
VRHPFRIVAAIVMFLLGIVWIGQGIGLVGGSAMSGQSIWAVIGAILVGAAAVTFWTARRPTQG